jgi:hypothetical protein
MSANSLSAVNDWSDIEQDLLVQLLKAALQGLPAACEIFASLG